MRNFMKKSSLAFLMVVLVLLTAILVGGMITASAEDAVEPEATLYNGTTVVKSGTFSEVIAAVHGHSAKSNYKLVLHKDVELAEVFYVKCIAEFDGQGHTVYIDESYNTSARAWFMMVTHEGTTVFKNVNFVGQDKDWDVGDWANAKQFGTNNAQNAAGIYVPAGARVEMVNCTMQYFFSAARASAIVVAQNAGTTYDENAGLYLTNTKIQNNLTTGTTNSSAVYVTPGFAADGRYGNLLHVSGDTVVENNYRVTRTETVDEETSEVTDVDVVVNSAYANVYVQQSTVANYQATSTILVHPDFTGSVGIIRGGGAVANGAKRGVVFFLEDTASTRTGKIYESSASGPKSIEPVGTTVVPFETTEGVTCTFNGIWADLSAVLPNITATFVLKDSTGAETLASYEATRAQGAALPTWTAWSDGVIDTTVATFGRTTYTVILPATTEAIANNAQSGAWSASTLADFIATGSCTEIEVLKDIEIAATITFPNDCNMTVDFGGHTVTKSDSTAKFYLSTRAKVTIKNAIFDGESDPILVKGSTEASAAIRDATYYMIQANTADLTLDQCTFTNCTGGSIHLTATKLVLDDVAIVGGGEAVSAVEARANSSIYVAGNTQIVVTDGNSNNRINAYNVGASIGLAGTFTGQVVFDQWGYQLNRPTFYMSDRTYPTASNYNSSIPDRTDFCTVAEGAKLLGKIYSVNQANWVAFDNQGTLSWTKAGQALPTANLPAISVDPADDSKIYEYGWYYNTGAEDAEDVATSTVQTDIYNYFVKVTQVNADAYILRDGEVERYGTLTHILANASSGDAVEVMRDLVIPTAGISMNPAAFTVDFNNFTVTRESKTSYISVNGTAADIVWKNGNFDGTIAEAVPTDGRVFLDFANSDVKLDSCTFANFRTDGGTEGGSDSNANRGSVVRLRYTGTLTLKDVTMTNCGALYGAVYCFNTIEQQPHIYIEGNTTITCTAGGTNRIHLGTQGGSTLNVSGDFTGTVDVQHSNNKGYNAPVTTKNSGQTNEIATPTVAAGAKIMGHIYQSDTHTYFAYNNQGVLCWTTAGAALPTLSGVKVNATDKTKIDVTAWFYDNNGVETQTDVAISDVANYTVKTVAIEVEAYIVRDGVVAEYGDFVDVVADIASNDTVEVVKNVTGVKDIVVDKPITINGNGNTMTWYTTETPAEVTTEDSAVGATYLFYNTSALTLKDFVFDGGAAEAGVWPTGARNRDNSVMFYHRAALTFDGCTIKGARVEYTKTGDIGMLFGYTTSALTFKDTTVVDNIFKKPASAMRLFRQANNNGITLYEGEIVFKDNFSLVTKDDVTSAYAEGAACFGAALRTRIGELAEGSELHFYSNITEYSVLLDASGKPFDNSGKIFMDYGNNPVAVDEDGKLALADAEYSYLPRGFAFSGAYTTPVAHNKMYIVTNTNTAVGSTSGGGAITRDKFDLKYYSAIIADYYTTNVVVKINGKVVSETALNTIVPEEGLYEIPVSVGMAELADAIVIELQNQAGDVLATYETAAKTYALGLINADYTTLTNPNTLAAYTEEEALAVRKAIASLLQYGAKVQTFFGYNTANLAMTDDELATWKAAGLVLDVAENEIGTSAAAVKATASGTLPAGLTVSGATLTMENEISLRLYFALAEGKTIADYTFTVDGASVEAVEVGNGTYYIEAAHIGTQSLASLIPFGITGDTTYTYNASPMSYVYTVNTSTHASITQNLKDACEALYYYYAAVADCFGFADGTGFSQAGLSLASDTIDNGFGPLAGVVAE